ncbi:MAG: MFS transporter [Desulfuromonadales bacterium]|nr:MFS transporter [Desulfuromonadales bacterium]
MEKHNLFRGLFLINFLITLGFGISDAFFSLFVFSLGGRGLLLGLPLVLYSLSKILCSPFLGAWADRVGQRRIAVVSLGLYLFVSLCFCFTTSLALITLLRLLQGMACALFRPVLVSLVNSCVSNEKRATWLGTFDISFYGALGLGPVAGGLLKDLWGFRGIFVTLVLLCALALVVALLLIPASGTVGRRQTGQFGKLMDMTRHGTLRGLLAFIFGRSCGISLMGSFLPIMLSARMGLSGARAGLVLAAGTVVMTLLLRPAGMLSDRMPRKLLVVVGGVGVSLLYVLLPIANGFYPALLLGVGIGLFSVLSQPASTTLLAEEGNKHGMGLTVGTFNAVLNLGFVVGPLLGAGLHAGFGLNVVFYVAGLIGLMTVGLFVFSALPEARVGLCQRHYRLTENYR